MQHSSDTVVHGCLARHLTTRPAQPDGLESRMYSDLKNFATKMNFRRDAMPNAVAALLPYAEEWGISDDYERELKVADAGDFQLLDLICSMDAADQDSLLAWLEGPESYHPNPTEDYVALKCLVMAVESAKAKLRDRGILV